MSQIHVHSQSQSFVIQPATHLGRRNNREGGHHSVRVFLSNLRNKKRSHTGTSSTSKRVSDLETLQAVGTFGLLSNNVQDRVDKLGSYRNAQVSSSDQYWVRLLDASARD